MKNQIYISWGSGNSIFYLPEFFPCTQAKLKKFVKLLKTDFETRDENINTCINHINYRIDNITDEMKEISRLYVNTGDEKSGLEDCIKWRRRPNGVPLRKDEIKKLKRSLYAVKRKLKALDDIFNTYARTRNKLINNLELFKKLCDVT